LRLPGRLLASLGAAAMGWAAGNIMTASLILLRSASFNWQGWAMASGAVCLAAWAVAGIPLAVSGAAFPPGPERAKAILFAGLGSGCAAAILFGPGAVASAGATTLLLIAAGQALASGGAGMLAYCLLTGGGSRAPSGTNSPRN